MMKVIIASILLGSWCCLTCNSCQHKKDAHIPHEEHPASHEAEIILTAAQSKTAQLQYETVTPKAFTGVIKTSGQILSTLQDDCTVTATCNGIVKLGTPSLLPGSPIQNGQTLFFISAQNLQDGDPLTKNKATFEAAQQAWHRAEQLVQDHIISQKEYEAARLRYQIAKATYEGQSSHQTAKGTAIAAPQQGFLKNIFVQSGDYVTVGTPLATLTKNQRLQLRADVPQRYYGELAQIRTAHFTVSYDTTLYKLDEMHGKLCSYGKVATENSAYLPLFFELDNRGKLIPGSLAEIYLLTATSNPALSVPKTALTEEQGAFFVYVRTPHHSHSYQKREVQLGKNNGERFEIVDGLKAGEQVVVKGAYQLRLAAQSATLPSGHQH